MMVLCLPTTDASGLASRLSPHFGSAPFFTLVDTDSARLEIIGNAHARHEHGQCDPIKGLDGRRIDAVVCRGLGRRALAGLHGGGIPVLVTEAWTVLEAVEAFRAEALRPLTEDEACEGGHGHGHREHGAEQHPTS